MAEKKYKKRVHTKPEWCKGCKLCVSFCPKSCLALDLHDRIQMVKPDECIRCGMCQNLCPDFAIFLLEDNTEFSELEDKKLSETNINQKDA